MIVEEDGLRGDTLRNHNLVFVVVVAASITTVQTVTPGLLSFLIFSERSWVGQGHGRSGLRTPLFCNNENK